MPLAGLVINRIHVSGLDVSAERALSLAEDLTRRGRRWRSRRCAGTPTWRG